MRSRGGFTGSETDCPECGGGPCRVRWVLFAGSGYANDNAGAAMAISRAHRAVTTPSERAQAVQFAGNIDARRAQLVPARCGWGVTIANEDEWIAQHQTQTGALHANHDRVDRQNRRTKRRPG